MSGVCVPLDFQCCPPVSVQDQQVRKALNIIWIVFQYNASGKIFLNPPYQLCLKCSLQNIQSPPLRKGQKERRRVRVQAERLSNAPKRRFPILLY